MRRKILEIRKEHETWLQSFGKRGKRADLSGQDLTGIHLNNANLKGAIMAGTTLAYANLQEANLIGANLDGANLDGADMKRASLVEAVLHNAVLTRANLFGVNLIDACCSYADFSDAILQHAEAQGADFFCAILSRANLSSSNFSNADFTEAKLDQIVFNAQTAFFKRIYFGNYWFELKSGRRVVDKALIRQLDSATPSDPSLSYYQKHKFNPFKDIQIDPATLSAFLARFLIPELCQEILDEVCPQSRQAYIDLEDMAADNKAPGNGILP